MSEFDEKFLRNVILCEKKVLRNRDMLVGVNLPKSNTQSATDNASKSKICTLNCTLEETAVLRCFEANPKVTQKEMASIIRKSERNVKTLTTTLVEKAS